MELDAPIGRKMLELSRRDEFTIDPGEPSDHKAIGEEDELSSQSEGDSSSSSSAKIGLSDSLIVIKYAPEQKEEVQSSTLPEKEPEKPATVLPPSSIIVREEKRPLQSSFNADLLIPLEIDDSSARNSEHLYVLSAFSCLLDND